MSSFDMMNWEQRDPSGATVRGIGEQELDPLGADAGTFATSVPPTERAIVSYGASYNPAHPNFTYWVDGVRVPVESFVAFGGFKLRDPLGLLEEWARASAKPIGYRNTGVRWGERYEVIYDANGKLIFQASTFDASLRDVSFGVESPIYSNTHFDPTLLLQHIRGSQRSVSPAELKQISADLETALKRKECADFLKALLDEAAIVSGEPYRDIMVTFDNVTFTYGDTGATGGRAYGSFEQKNASAVINPFEENFISEDRNAFIRTQTALNFLGETLHHVGTKSAYTDGVFANALNAILVREGKDIKKTFSDKTEAEVVNASNYWHPIQYERCKMRYK